MSFVLYICYLDFNTQDYRAIILLGTRTSGRLCRHERELLAHSVEPGVVQHCA